MGRGAEGVTPVQERDALGDFVKIQRPIERRIPAAHDQHLAAAEILHPPHGVEDAFPFETLDPRDRRPFRLKRPATRRHHDAFAQETGAGIRHEPEARRLGSAKRLDAHDHLGEMKLRLERRDLLQQIVSEALAGDDRHPRNVVDGLFGIELGALPADLVENVDDMAFDVEKAELEHREQAARSSTDDDHIGLMRRAKTGLIHGRLHHQHPSISIRTKSFVYERIANPRTHLQWPVDKACERGREAGTPSLLVSIVFFERDGRIYLVPNSRCARRLRE